MVGNNVLHSLAVGCEGGLFLSGDLHFVELFYCCPLFFCPTFSDMCVNLVSSTLAAYREFSQSKNRPVSKMYLGGGAEVGKDLTFYVPHEVHFFPFNLNIGVDNSAIV